MIIDQETITEIIGIIGTGLVFFSVLCNNMKRLRYLNILACIVYSIYAILIESNPLLVTNIGIMLVHTYRLKINDRKNIEKNAI